MRIKRLLFTLLLALAGHAFAQAWPQKGPIKLVAVYPPGGSVDPVARILAPAWWAVLAPAKTPPEIVERMNDEINAVLTKPEVRDKLAAQGIDIRAGTPEAARSFIEGQMDIWAKVVKDNAIKAD